MAVTKVSSVLACLALARALEGQQQGALRGRVNATILHSTSEAKRGKRRRSACDCMNWAGVYYDSLAMCGRAEELYFLSKFGFSAAYAATEPIAGLPHRVCNDFLKNFKNDSCIMVDQYPFPADAMTNKQWCYVANDCDTLNGGDYATNTMGFQLGGWNNLASTSNLSWKICDQSTDSILKYKTMDELTAIGSESDISMAMLLRLSYPAVTITWGEAKIFMETLNEQYDSNLALTDNVNAIAIPPTTWGLRLTEVDTTLRGIVTSEQGTILDSPGHRDEFHVVVGREVWEVKRIDEGNMAYLAGKFYLEFDVACVLGCAPAAREAPLDLLTQ